MPYTGSGVSACIRSTDKVLAKHAMRDAGIPTPDFYSFTETAFRELGAAAALPAIEERLAFPIVVKPAGQGSALGIKFARTAADVPAALVAAFSYDDKVLLERYVAGRDLAVSVLDGEVLPIVEAVPDGEEFYDFEARYEIGRTDFVCPADLPEAISSAAQDLALRVFSLLGLAGFARVDLMLERETGRLYVLEANSIPGLTETSLLPQAADAAGIGFDALIGRIVDGALERAGGLACAGAALAGLLALAGLEVLGRDLVEEVLELLDDLLGVLDVVLELDRGLLDDVLGGEDRGPGAHRQGERVRGAGVDLELAAVDGQRDRGVEGVLAQLGDRDAGAGGVELAQHVGEEVVRHRARGAGALQLHQDGRRFGMTDPDGQELVRVDGLEQHDRLLADHVERDAIDDHLLHLLCSLTGLGAAV